MVQAHGAPTPPFTRPSTCAHKRTSAPAVLHPLLQVRHQLLWGALPQPVPAAPVEGIRAWVEWMRGGTMVAGVHLQAGRAHPRAHAGTSAWRCCPRLWHAVASVRHLLPPDRPSQAGTVRACLWCCCHRRLDVLHRPRLHGRAYAWTHAWARAMAEPHVLGQKQAQALARTHSWCTLQPWRHWASMAPMRTVRMHAQIQLPPLLLLLLLLPGPAPLARHGPAIPVSLHHPIGSLYYLWEGFGG